MKPLLYSVLCAFFLTVAFTSQAQAQDEAGKKYDNPQWKRVVMIDYKPGHYNKARDLVNTYHKKATEMAGTSGPESIMELHSGEYDLMVIWAMEGGISDMDWDVNPNGVKWRKAMYELAGGEEEAKAIMKEYSDCISRSTSYIARVEN